MINKELLKVVTKLLAGTIFASAGSQLIKKGLENANQIGGQKR